MAEASRASFVSVLSGIRHLHHPARRLCRTEAVEILEATLVGRVRSNLPDQVCSLSQLRMVPSRVSTASPSISSVPHGMDSTTAPSSTAWWYASGAPVLCFQVPCRCSGQDSLISVSDSYGSHHDAKFSPASGECWTSSFVIHSAHTSRLDQAYDSGRKGFARETTQMHRKCPNFREMFAWLSLA